MKIITDSYCLVTFYTTLPPEIEDVKDAKKRIRMFEEYINNPRAPLVNCRCSYKWMEE